MYKVRSKRVKGVCYRLCVREKHFGTDQPFYYKRRHYPPQSPQTEQQTIIVMNKCILKARLPSHWFSDISAIAKSFILHSLQNGSMAMTFPTFVCAWGLRESMALYLTVRNFLSSTIIWHGKVYRLKWGGEIVQKIDINNKRNVILKEL